MKPFLPILLLLVTAALARADAEAEARASIAIALAQQQPAGQTYAEARAQALKDGLPLVVGIGYDPPQPMTPGAWLVVKVYDLPGIPGPGIVVCVPQGGELKWLDVLPVASTCHDCADMLGRLRQALDFSSSNQGSPVAKGYHGMQQPQQFYHPGNLMMHTPPMMMMGGGGCSPRG